MNAFANGGRSLTASLWIVLLSLLMPEAILAQEPGAAAAGGDEGIGETGTDPRDFAAKFMPYYRFTELENGLEQNELVLFGLVPFSKRVAMTFEIPLAYERDITNTAACAGLPDIPCFGTVPGGGVTLPNGLPAEGDGQETGVGDMNLRVFARMDWSFLGGDWLLGAEMVFPTATDPVLGSETFMVKPMITYVRDLGFWPGPGAFVASMNFYNFDVWKDSGRGDISQYIGRHFFMLPLHPSGIYALPEIQTIYDFETEHFSFWIGPEFGKLLAPGRILYAKPGWGVDPKASKGDRKWSFELGFRWFF